MFEAIKLVFIVFFYTIYSFFFTNTFSAGFSDQPKSFLPHEARSDSEKAVSELVFKKLFKFNGDVLVPELIESYSVSEDKKIYTLKLKNNIKWQDNTDITSSDVLYTLSLYEDFISNMEIEKTGKKEVKITLNTPIAILPSLLTIGLEPAHLQGQDKLKPIGSTSFIITRISRERAAIESATLFSTKDDKPYNRLVFRFYKNERDLKTAYKMGEIDAFYSDTPFEEKGAIAKSIQFLGRYYVLVFNTKKEPLKEVNLRELLASALNANELFDKNFYRNSVIADGPISKSVYTKETFKNHKAKTGIRLSTSQEKQLNGLKILLPDNIEGRQIEPFIKEQWGKNLNLEISIEYLPPNEFSNSTRVDDSDVYFVGHEVTPDPDRYAFWHSTQSSNGGLNLGHFEDLRSDKSLEEGRNFTEFTDRQKHYNIFQDVIEVKIPGVFLYHPGKYFYISEAKSKFNIPDKIYYPWDIFKNL